MPSTVRCPRCGKTYRLADSSPRASFHCSACQISVPLSYIGRYQVLGKLGEGGFGIVYRVYDPKMQREAALKELHDTWLRDKEVVQRFNQEVRITARIDHEHVVKVYDVQINTQQGEYFLVTALIHGKTLSSMIPKEGIRDPFEAVRIAIKLLDTLEEVHTRYRVCHRDIKPSNIMLNEKGFLYLMDFGMAACLDQESSRLTRSGTTMGTPAYMSPEQVEGNTRLVGYASDQYGAAVVLYHMLTGRLPFRKKAPAIFSQILEERPQPPSELREDIDPALEKIILRALEKRPEDRFPSCQAFADRLREWREKYLLAGRSGGTPPFLAIIGAIALLAGLAAGAYFALNWWEGRNRVDAPLGPNQGDKQKWQPKHMP